MMGEFDTLMEEISSELGIAQETGESKSSWYGRMILSVASRTGQAALWDAEEEDESCSLIHYKRKMKSVLDSYFKMFPDVKEEFYSCDSENMLDSLLEYIEFLNTNTGNLYHSDRHVHPVMPRAAKLGVVTLTRGFSIDTPQYISGMGTYVKRLLDMQLDDPVDMFHLHRGKMKDNWKSITSNLSKWEDLEDKDNMEYMSLNITPRSPRAWSQKPNRNGEISLARLEVGPKQYLYRFYFYKNGRFRYHDLTSPWDGEESYLRNACLCSMNRLPEITMEDRGADVLLNFQYVLPKAERYLVNLYSWGPVMSNFNSNFHRLMNKDVFNGIRKILELEGYVFVSQ